MPRLIMQFDPGDSEAQHRRVADSAEKHAAALDHLDKSLPKVERGSRESARALSEEEKAQRAAAAAAAEAARAEQQLSQIKAHFIDQARQVTANAREQLAAEQALAGGAQRLAREQALLAKTTAEQRAAMGDVIAVMREEAAATEVLERQLADLQQARARSAAAQGEIRELERRVQLNAREAETIRRAAAEGRDLAVVHRQLAAAREAEDRIQRLGIDLNSREAAQIRQLTARLHEQRTAQTQVAASGQGVLNFLGGMGLAVTGVALAAAAWRGIREGVIGSVRAFAEAEAQGRQLEQAINAGANAAGHQREELLRLADSVADLAGVDDDLVVSAESVLLTFSRINRETFPEALRLAADLSARFGGDLVSASEAVGKALQDPAQASLALRAAKIRLTEAQEKEIDAAVKVGDTYRAQRVVLDELTERVGGSATAAGESFAGTLARLNTASGNLRESFGEGLAPAIEVVSEQLTELAKDRETLEFLKELGGLLGGILKTTAELSKFSVPGIVLGIRQQLGESDLERMQREVAALDAQLSALQNVPGASPIEQRANELAIVELTERRAALLARMQPLLEHEAALDEERYLREGRVNAERNRQARERQRELDDADRAAAATAAREEAAKKARAEAIREAEQIRNEIEALRSPAKELLDTYTSWADRLERGKITLEQWQGVMAALARNNPFEPIVASLREIVSIVPPIGLPFDVARPAAARVQTDPNANPFLVGPPIELFTQQQVDRAEEFSSLLEDIGLGETRREELTRRLNDLWGTAIKEGSEYQHILEIIRDLTDDTAARTAAMVDSLQSTAGLLGQLGRISGNQSINQAGAFVNAASDAYAAGQNATSVGGWSAYAGAFTAYLAVVQVAVEAFQGHIERRRAKWLENVAVVARIGEQWELSANGVDAQARSAARQITESIDAIAASMGGVIESFADIQVFASRDGKTFEARVRGELVGRFQDVNDAMSAAIAQAFADPETSLRGLSELVRQGLQELFASDEFTAGMVDATEMQRFGATLREIAELDWASGARQTIEAVRGFVEMFDTLARLRELTPAVAQGFNSISTAVVETWQNWRDSITGRQQTQAELLEQKRREALLFNAQMDLFRAELAMRRLDLQAQRDSIEAEGRLLRNRFEIDRAGIAAAGASLAARQELAAAEIASLQRYLNAKSAAVGAEGALTNQAIAIIDAQMRAIDAILANLPAAIDLGEISLPGAGAGGGRRREREAFEVSLQDIIDSALPEWSRRLKELRDDLAETAAEAARLGANADLTAQALAAMSEAVRRDLLEMIEEALGGDSWSAQAEAIRDRWREVTDAVRQHLEETGERLVPFWQLQAAEAAELLALTEDAIDSLGSPFEAIRDRFDELSETLRFLHEQMVSGVISGERYAQAVGEWAQQAFLEVGNSLISFLDRYYGEIEDGQALRAELQRVQFEVEMQQLRLQIEMWAEFGVITKDVRDRWLGILNNLPEPSFGGGSGAGGGFGGPPANDNTDIASEREAFRERLRDILDLDLSPIERRYRDLQRELAELASEGMRLGFSMREIAEAQSALVRDFWREVTDPIRDFYDSLNLSDLSPLTDAQQFAEAQRQALATVQAAQGGDLQAIQNLPDVLRQYLESTGAQFGTAGSYYAEIFAWVQQIARQFANYQGGTIPAPRPPSTANVLPFGSSSQVPVTLPSSTQQTNLQRPAASDPATAQILAATLEQNATLRALLRVSQEQLELERGRNRGTARSAA